MKKSTLFVLLLAAVLLFMTACNPATNEPAATDDPTKIPGVTEDQNVPSKDKLVDLEDTDIESIINTLRNFNFFNAYSNEYEVTAHFKAKLKDGATLAYQGGKALAFSGSATIGHSSKYTTGNGSSNTTFVDGTLKLGNDEYVYSDFKATYSSGSSESKGGYKFSGKCTLKNNGELTATNDLIKASEIANQVNPENANVSDIYSNAVVTFVYDKKAESTISYRVSMTNLSEATVVMIVNLKNIEGHTITAKYYGQINPSSEEPALSDMTIEYASFDGVYFKPNSLINNKEIKDLLSKLMLSIRI